MNCQEKILKNVLKFLNIFLKGSKVNYHFLSIRMQRKKDLVWAVHKRREPQRHLLVKNGT